jgi:phosphoribosylaminoimidazole-succinocarboxamide synthase
MPETAQHLASGKVREIYELDGERLLLVASDRISTFDVVLPTTIPDKGRVLTGLSAFWFARTQDIVPNHFLAVRSDGRSTEVRRLRMLPIECVVRGYLAGSGWKEYQQSQTVCGVQIPPGLRQCDKLPQPIFTPATKEESGHDINISFEEAAERISEPAARELRFHTLDLYSFAADYAAQRGILIADTKFEFGVVNESRLMLVDEVLTPDSSRFWPADQYEPGHDQPSFDKQYVRNWLETQPWDKTPPAPALPPEVVEGTKRRYLEAYERLTGKTLDV